jgi:hypothetical protein
MYSKRLNDDDINGITDLASISTEVDKEYICKYCKQELLVEYPEAQVENPFAGLSFICPKCNRVYDSSLEKLPTKPRPIRSSLGQQMISNNNEITPLFETIALSFDLANDEYGALDPEGDTDERMKAEGWHIIDSRIELIDSHGRNRTIVKRSSETRKL